MGDYARWQTALKNWAAAATGLPVVWENEPRGFGPQTASGARIFCILTGPLEVRTSGQDWLRDTEVGDALIPIPVGPRVATYSLRVISRDQSPDSRAGRYAELARMALSLPVVREAFRVAGMGLQSAASIRMVDVPWDDRWESVATLDTAWHVAPNDQPAGVDQGWIERVTMASSVEPAGEPPNVTALTVPPVDP